MVLKNLKKLRMEAEFSREYLAQLAMMSSKTIANMEAGRGTTRNNGIRIAKALKCKLEDLVREDHP